MNLSTIQKALRINLDPSTYGTFAEIGAGQEVARFFFQAGGAAGTIAKTISAYDMQVSDSIYGECSRYVSLERVKVMVRREYDLMSSRLSKERAQKTRFFAFADTVAARGYKKSDKHHGWVAIRFQLNPQEEPNEIFLHVRMHDLTNQQQQNALGILGVNLIYSSFHSSDSPTRLAEELLDELGWERLEIDYIHLEGPHFKGIDSRLLVLHLVKIGHTEVALFSNDGHTSLASDTLYKKNAIVMRGTFRPPLTVHFDMVQNVQKALPLKDQEQSITLFEMNIAPLLANDNIDLQEILDRIDMFSSMGFPVMISRFYRYFRLSEYLRSLSTSALHFVMGPDQLPHIFDPQYYDGHPGGTLHALGLLFGNSVDVYVCTDTSENKISHSVPGKEQALLDYLVSYNKVQFLSDNYGSTLVSSEDILEKIASKEEGWESLIPEKIRAFILKKQLLH